MKTFIAMCLTALLSTAHAQFINGNQLHADFNGSASDKAFALGYVSGVVDSFDEELFCVPVKAELGQLRDIVRKFVASNPKERHRHAGALVVFSLATEFPCKKGGV
jgi:hypothetical protein